VLLPLLKLQVQLPRVLVPLLVLLLKPLVQVQRVVPQVPPVLQRQVLPARLQRVL
jgi:hypothetical protein